MKLLLPFLGMVWIQCGPVSIDAEDLPDTSLVFETLEDSSEPSEVNSDDFTDFSQNYDDFPTEYKDKEDASLWAEKEGSRVPERLACLASCPSPVKVPLLASFDETHAQEIANHQKHLENLVSYLRFQNQGSPREKTLFFLENQFATLPKVRQESLDLLSSAPLAIQKIFQLVRIQILDQKIYATSQSHRHDCVQSMMESLEKVLEKYSIPPVDFVVYTEDIVPLNAHFQSPEDWDFWSAKFFETPNLHSNVNPKKPQYFRSILWPDLYMMNLQKYKLFKKIASYSEKNPWEERLPIIGWRGASTGPHIHFDLFSFTSPRSILVSLSPSFPQILDAKMSFYPSTQISPTLSGKLWRGLMENFYPPVGRIPEEDLLKFRYLISVDGNGAAWERVPWILSSSSLLLLQSEFLQWFYPALTPMVHYIPMDQNLENLFDVHFWLKNHDAQAKNIALKALESSSQLFSQEAILESIAVTLKTYASLQTFSMQKPTLPPWKFAHE